MSSESSGYPCPYCHKRDLETTATAPYIRGLLVAYLIGSKTFIGCTSCVRKKVLGEAGLSLFIGWFSIAAIFLNPIFIIYNLIRGLLVRENQSAVNKKLSQMGLPDKLDVVDVNSVGCALAASMILADGKVEESEIRAAEEAGDRVFQGFDEAGLRLLLEHGKDLPPAEELAAMLRNTMDEDGKRKVMLFLSEIAQADGHVSPEERAMLERVGVSLGVVGKATAA